MIRKMRSLIFLGIRIVGWLVVFLVSQREQSYVDLQSYHTVALYRSSYYVLGSQKDKDVMGRSWL